MILSLFILSQHIQGAVKFDVDQIADLSAPLPQTVPPLAIFEDHMGKVRLYYII